MEKYLLTNKLLVAIYMELTYYIKLPKYFSKYHISKK